MRYNISMSRKGFSLIELLVYVAIFVMSSVFLVSMFIIFTRIHVRQSSLNEVNSQVSFVNDVIQRLVRSSSVIGTAAGAATSTLTLRMASSTVDPTLVYFEGGVIYLREGEDEPIALTSSPLAVDDFSVTKYENEGGYSFVRFDLAVHYDAESEGAKFRRTLSSAVSRASAATFDSSVLPNSSASYDLGSATKSWQNLYISGGIGIGTQPVAAAGIKSADDIAFTTSSVGLILVAPNSSCYRLTVGNGGVFATSSVSCP